MGHMALELMTQLATGLVPSSTKEYQEVMGRSLQTVKTVKICEDLWRSVKCEARDRSGSCCHAGSEDSEDSEGLAWPVEPHWGCMGNLQKQPWRDQLGRSVDRAWGRMWMDVDGCRFGVRKTMENSSNLNWKAKKDQLLVSLSIS